jgi:dTDP-4-dehydrorhamnose reductase
MMARLLRSVLVEQRTLEGTLQVSSGPINKYDLLRLLDRAYGTATEVVPSDTMRIDRSLDSSLFRALTGFVPPSWTEMVEGMAADPTPYDAWHQART